MRKNNYMDAPPAGRFVLAVLLFILSTLTATGCNVTGKAGYWGGPVSEIKDVPIDTATLYPEDQALDYAIRLLNASKWGLLLRRSSSGGNKIFTFDQIYFKVKEKVTHRRWKKDSIYIVTISNNCRSLENDDRPTTRYGKTVYFKKQKAEQVATALVSLGATPCSLSSGGQQ